MSNSSRYTNSHKIICWHLTNKCTRNCDFCLSKSSTNHKLNHITNYKSVIDKIKELGFEKISYSGGEPFIVPNFENIVNYGKEKGLIQIVTTNGDLLFKNFDIAFLRKFQYLKFSFYGTSQYHDNLIGKGHFQKLISLITALKPYNINIGINYMLTQQSYLALEEFIQQISKFQLYSFLIQSYIPTGNSIIDSNYIIDKFDLTFLSNYVNYFEQGIKHFDYNVKEGFQVILDDKQNIYFPNTLNCSRFYYGSVFEKEKDFENIGLIQLNKLVEQVVNKRVFSNEIKTY